MQERKSEEGCEDVMVRDVRGVRCEREGKVSERVTYIRYR